MKNGVDLKQLKSWIIKNYGKKCKTFDPCCSCCIMWRIYGIIVNNYKDLKKMLRILEL